MAMGQAERGMNPFAILLLIVLGLTGRLLARWDERKKGG